MTLLVDGGAGSGGLLDKKSRLLIFPSTLHFLPVLLAVCFAILVPVARAQGSGDASNLGIGSQRSVVAYSLPVNAGGGDSAENSAENPAENPAAKTKVQKPQRAKAPDSNRDIYYRNRLEYSLEVGWFPINVPFPFDVLEGDAYDLYPLRYTLVPVLASLRWHLNDVGGPIILRGNYDLTFTAGITAIPRGAETRYFSYNMGIRRNFVPRNWRVSPYFDMRAGLGLIDAKGPVGVYFAQGQNFTFNLNMGSGVRYNFNPRYGITAGLNWMHISNANLSSPLYSNYGINVYGPLFGLDIQLRRNKRHDGQ